MTERIIPLENYLDSLATKARLERAASLRTAANDVETGDASAEGNHLSIAEQHLQDLNLYNKGREEFQGFQSTVVRGVTDWFTNSGIPLPQGSRVFLAIDTGQQVEETVSSKQLSPKEKEARIKQIRLNLGNSAAFEHLGPRLDTTIEELFEDRDVSLSLRTFNALKRGGVRNVREILGKSEDGLFDIRNFGRLCLTETLSVLVQRGFLPTTELDDFPLQITKREEPELPDFDINPKKIS